MLLIAQYFPEIVGFLSNEIYNLEKETSLIDILRIKTLQLIAVSSSKPTKFYVRISARQQY